MMARISFIVWFPFPGPVPHEGHVGLAPVDINNRAYRQDGVWAGCRFQQLHITIRASLYKFCKWLIKMD
jgi:hypothetical protein